jgi:hypothetical protein
VRRQLAAIALAALAACAGAPPLAAAQPRERERDVVVRSAPIPTAKNVHGELRWIRRGSATCLQTLLYTPSLRLGIDAMRKKEMKAWPSGSAGYADSSRYVSMMEDASREALRRFEARSDKASRLQTMAIEFTIAGNDATFATFMLDVAKDGDRVTVVRMEPFAKSKASFAYVAGAMRLQAAAAFGSVPDELEERLASPR